MTLSPTFRRSYVRFASRYLPVVHCLVDGAAWAAAVPVTTLLRYDLAVDRVHLAGMLIATAAVACLQAIFGYLTGLYRRKFRYGSLRRGRCSRLFRCRCGCQPHRGLACSA